MVLVDYSDSEGSDDEQPTAPPKPLATTTAKTNFAIDKVNPQKIRVKLSDIAASNGTHEDEPAPKRARLGGGSSGFNAMLPPPKRQAEAAAPSSNKPVRKVFSLKTGAERGFSRESDAELKQLFAEQASGQQEIAASQDVGLPSVPKRTEPVEPAVKGNTFMFKPLSVARNPKKKKKPSSVAATSEHQTSGPAPEPKTEAKVAETAPQKKKTSLFSSYTEGDVQPVSLEAERDAAEEHPEDGVTSSYADFAPDASSYHSQQAQSQSLNSIASDLNLSAAERRQLFGRSRHGETDVSASSVVNFNTDAEYAHNEALRANGETVQHNPVRAIAPGKHSLRQLVSAAQGQKEALEESFATGKRNRKEAGNKYGW
jgi:hypothetical protein